MTRYEYIKNMSLHELATFLNLHDDCSLCNYRHDCSSLTRDNITCINGIIEWLDTSASKKVKRLDYYSNNYDKALSDFARENEYLPSEVRPIEFLNWMLKETEVYE